MIPNICYFVFGLERQTEEFLFSHYIAVYSAFLVNKPKKIYFYYHHTPFGEWWEELKKIPNVHLRRIQIPTHVGKKKIVKTAHRADIVRMNLLYANGGIYLDIDTICVKPWVHLLDNDVVLGREGNDGICNAIMFTKPKSMFFKLWLGRYEKEFEPNGWREASIVLPYALAKRHPELLTLKEEDVFFLPSHNETSQIFADKRTIPENLVSLHLWETFSLEYLRQIKDWSWAHDNRHTMYGRILLHLKECADGMGKPEPPLQPSVPVIPSNVFLTFPVRTPPGQTWARMNPAWNVEWYDDDDCKVFLRNDPEFCTDVYAAYTSLPRGAPRADLWRYCVVYRRGGVYVDADCACTVPLDEWLPRQQSLVVPVDHVVPYNAVFQAFIAARPNHPVLRRCINYVVQQVRLGFRIRSSQDVFRLSGPICFARCLNAYLGREENALLTPHDVMNKGITLLGHCTEKTNDSVLTADGRTVLRCQLPIDRTVAGKHYSLLQYTFNDQLPNAKNRH